MASISIFTFDHDPPRVSSPWVTPPPGSRSHHVTQDAVSLPSGAMSDTGISNIDYSTITKLDAEPQDGPTEYKLHLLLRRRRSFSRVTTGKNISGALHRLETPYPSSVGRSVSESGLLSSTPPPLATTQSRQHRLEQLTTQLFWRLQQSCPHHVSSSSPLVVPQFPDEPQLSTHAIPQRLPPGLEESKGALYEIGVADDGTFVGLAEDEMDESLNNLRAMAASLGCRVDVLRMVQVGECEWLETHDDSGVSRPQTKTGKLWVAEALVQPAQYSFGRADTGNARSDIQTTDSLQPATGPSPLGGLEARTITQQLRVTVTGATMSGKSSLLGSLSTSTLDNGRGKSRLSLLRHRHEIASGMTSSVTQELIGYRDIIGPDGTKDSVQVVSYGNGDVSEWLDIHASAEGGRLVFLSDSAGHPRFRRTTVRGLVGWDPNWTLLCISADSTEDSVLKVQELPGTTPADTDLSQAHLRLCLNLELPLVVVITKYDLATKQGLRHTLSRLLSAIKDAGRTPRIVSAPSEATSEIDLNTVSACDLAQVRPLVQTLESSSLAVVPIILTSAVKGVGITILHALLRELPLPSIQEPKDDTLETLFHIEDVYSNILAPARDASLSNRSDRSVVIAGHLRYGTLRIGQELLLGPYVVDTVSDDSDSGSGPGSTLQRRRPHSSVPTSRSFPGALSKRSQLSAIDKQLEWRSVRITSLRNLRLPVRSLHAGQVGTIGIAPVDVPIAGPAAVRIRKGMVLGKGQLRAHRIIAVKFTGSNADAVKGLSVGSGVVVYVASVRASAKVVSVAAELDRQQPVNSHHDEEDAAFGFGFDDDEDDTVLETTRAPATVVTFQFIASREFFEVDAKVLVLPGGGPGLYVGTERGEKGIAALEGFVGRVTEGC